MALVKDSTLEHNSAMHSLPTGDLLGWQRGAGTGRHDERALTDSTKTARMRHDASSLIDRPRV
jgi:hypothetical protein